MRILLIIPYGGVGGIERLALNFYNFYKSKGYEVKVLKIIKLPTDIVNFGEDEYSLSNIDFSGMGRLERLFFYVKAPWKLRQIIQKNRFNYSLGFGDMSNIFSSLTFTKEYKIVSIHSTKSKEFTDNTFLNRLSKLSYKTSYYFLDKVVCISKAIKEDLLQNCGFAFPEKLKVIYNPHHIAEIEKMAEIPLETEEEKKIFQKKTILFLGRLTTVKSPWHLLKAFSLLKNADCNLVFVGDGAPDVLEYMNQLVGQLGLNEKVFFLGRKANPYQYLKQASVLALSSKYEGTPNVIVEAIACGIPVVSSNCTAGLPELMSNSLLEKDGDLVITESGIITPTFFDNKIALPENNHSTQEEQVFAEALERVLYDTKYAENLIANRTTLLQKYDLEKVALAYLNQNN
ncbi:glycosyltransferase [Flavobacterium mekongense]|uniref:glycosyltransferase n=1 Tax=Flavobacterium mekongense TaxID=3379707 RepID=UPI00399BA9BB